MNVERQTSAARCAAAFEPGAGDGWEPEELVAGWTLLEEDRRLVANKTGATRLGFALLLKFFELNARFAVSADELPAVAVDYVARQVGVDPAELARYAWSGRTIEYHRAQVRQALGFREASRADEARLTAWLAEDVAVAEPSDERLRQALLARCRSERLEPPGRLDRIVASARSTAAARFSETVTARLPADVAARLDALVAEPTDEARDRGRGELAELKADPGRASLETLLGEIDKLERARALGLPADLFDDAPEQLVAAWRSRAAAEYPSDLRARPRAVRLTLLAALCHARTTEITDSLIELLIALVHKINARAERRVEGELIADLRRVRGKEAILFRLAEAALEQPDETVRRALYPVVGETTLRDLVREARANEQAFRARVRTVLRSSYSAHYRRLLPRLLAALQFRSGNARHRPVIDALDLLGRYAHRPGAQRYYAPDEDLPLDGVVPAEWRDAVVDERGRVERIPYELCVLRALRDGLRRRDIWVMGARRWRDPEHDLPADFEQHRTLHYGALRQPLDPTAFVADLRARMTSALDALDRALTANDAGGTAITRRRGEPWIGVPRLEPLPEPAHLAELKGEVLRRWGTVDLLHLFKEADRLAGFTDEFGSVASREVIPREQLRRRLLLVLFALGTNTGISRIAGGGHGESEAALRHVRRLFVTRENLRRAIVRLVNATLAARDPVLWGAGTACASDSK